MKKVTVTVPATTANIGVGFDCLGAALTMGNQFEFVTEETERRLSITVTGTEAAKVSRNEGNLIYQSWLKVYHRIKQTPPNLKLKIDLGVPFSRGLGSSATAIVGGLLGANSLAGNPLNQREIRDMAIAIEGHPDNVVPALLGNCQLSVADGDRWQISSIPWHHEVIPVVAIPNFELSTREARAVLPNSYSRQEAIFNISRMGLLLRGLETNQQQWLTTALADRLHQPYRQKLIIGYEAVQQAAIAAGAYGMVISGAGPTLLALSNSGRVEEVVAAMKSAWSKLGVEADVRSLSIDTAGARVNADS